MELKNWMMEARVLLGMLVVQAIATVLQILSRVILSENTFIFALITYRHLVAAFSIAPFALFLERGAMRKITSQAFVYLFMVALTGIMTGVGLFYYGLKDTTATYATNFLNLIPVVTFLLSTILREGEARYEGWEDEKRRSNGMPCRRIDKGKSFNLNHHNTHHFLIKTHQNTTRGTIFLTGSCISYSFWFILQAKLFKLFPHKYSATLAICVIASVQATVMGLCLDRKPNSWRLGWNLQVITIFYSGVFATAVTFALVSMAITRKGPIYPSMFNPISLILILLIEAIFFAEDLHLGSLIGMVLIIAGLYSFLWGTHTGMQAASPPVGEISGGRDAEETTPGCNPPP